jgi:hypothetical protein
MHCGVVVGSLLPVVAALDVPESPVPPESFEDVEPFDGPVAVPLPSKWNRRCRRHHSP